VFGRVDPTSFTPECLHDPRVEALGRRVHTAEKPHPNPNAFYPQTLRLELSDGRSLERQIPHAWGHPLMPLSPLEREDKFRLCWRLTRQSGPAMEEAITWLKQLPAQTELAPLVQLLAG
jgi:2-methylcitrate dehydratase PrpD